MRCVARAGPVRVMLAPPGGAALGRGMTIGCVVTAPTARPEAGIKPEKLWGPYCWNRP